MKRLLQLFCAGTLISVLGVACDGGSEEERLSDSYCWLDGGGGIPLQRLDGKYYVMFYSADEEEFKNELAAVGAELIDMEEGTDNAGVSEGYKTATIESAYNKIKDALSLTFYWAPYYNTDLGQEGCLTNRFSILLKDPSDLAKLEELAGKHSVKMLDVSEFDWWLELACTNLSIGNTLEMGNPFYETGLFESVSYDLGGRGELL